MRRQGILVLGLAVSLASANVQADDSDSLFNQLGDSRPDMESGVELLDYELAKRVYYYHFLTGDSLNAVSDSETVATLADDEVSPTLPASFLGLGMDRFAGVLLADARLNQQPGLGNSWFMLAQRASEKGQWSMAGRLAERALQADSYLDETNQAEALFIVTTALANQNKLAEADDQLAELSASEWQKFASYNTMLAAMRLGAETADVQQRVSDTLWSNPETAEQVAFNDKVLLTAAKNELYKHRYDSAIELIRNISKDSPFTSDALLQYGWALSKRWQYDQALQPWRVLQENFEPLDPAVLESLMATAYIAELMQGDVESLPVYEYSEQRLTATLKQLEQLAGEDNIRRWVSNSVRSRSNKSAEEFAALSSNSSALPYSKLNRQLASLLSQSDFIEERQRLDDIVLMQQWVEQAQERLQQVRLQRADVQKYWQEDTLVDGLQQALQLLQPEIDHLKQLGLLETLKDAPFATRQEQERLQKLAAIEQQADGTELEINLQERARFYRGIQLWQANEERPARQWQWQKQLNALETQQQRLNISLQQTRQLAKQNAEFAANSEQHEQQLDNFEARLKGIEQSLQQVEQHQLDRVEEVAQQHIAMLTERLKHYLSTTRLAIARIYDNEFRASNLTGGLTDD